MIDGKSEAWMAIPSFYLENVGGTFIFKCNYDVDLLDLHGLPEFYVDTLKAWSEIKGECLPENHSQIRDEILWNNKNITLPENPFITKTGTLLGSKKLKIFKMAKLNSHLIKI